MALRVLLAETLQSVDGLRPFEEFSRVVKSACKVIKGNPAKTFKIMKAIGEGASGEIFRVMRLADE